jgi:pyruvate ferredoxin oxidoreductase beta subunit
VGKVKPGKLEWKKPIALIVAAHGAKYVATATISDPLDLYRKVKKAVQIEGPTFLHILTPCPTAWRFPIDQTIRIARLAVETGIFPLFEVEKGKLKLTIKEIKKPVIDYLRTQGRFAHLTPDQIKEVQEIVKRNFETLLNLQKRGKVFLSFS